MTPQELNQALDMLGWSKGDLAERLNVHRNTVSNWGRRVPGYVAAYVMLALKVRRLAAALSEL
jgi:DNA-binding transcriptional regulator YiaG